MACYPLVDLPALPPGVDTGLLSRAADIMSARWRLPTHVTAVALADMAHDLDVEVDALSQLVLDSLRWTPAPRAA